MSKKNRKKNRIETFRPTNEPKITQVEKPAEKNDDLLKDFRSLAMAIGFIVIIMLGIYYFDQKDNVLQYVTEKVFSAFR
jgi:flagellar biogenesis protein FliO